MSPKQLAILLTIGIAAIATLYRWRLLSSADRWIAVLMVATLAQEAVMAFMAYKYKNNFLTFHIYTPIETGIICMYFDRSMRFKHPYRIGGIIAGVSALISVYITLALQPIRGMNSYFFLYEGCLVIIFCLLSFYKLLIRDDIVPGRMTHFWLTISFLFYWSISYADLGLFARVPAEQERLRKIFTDTLYFANVGFYLGIITVFVRYKKLIPSGD